MTHPLPNKNAGEKVQIKKGWVRRRKFLRPIKLGQRKFVKLLSKKSNLNQSNKLVLLQSLGKNTARKQIVFVKGSASAWTINKLCLIGTTNIVSRVPEHAIAGKNVFAIMVQSASAVTISQPEESNRKQMLCTSSTLLIGKIYQTVIWILLTKK